VAEPKGLYGKYVVFKANDVRAVPLDGARGIARCYEAPLEAPVKGCFVLRPEKDKAALSALLQYATMTTDMKLRAELRAWADRIYAGEERAPSVGVPQPKRSG
jgi:hypothetical protein